MAVSFFLVQVRGFFLWHPGAPDSRASGRKLTAKSGQKQHENAIILRLFIQVRTKAPACLLTVPASAYNPLPGTAAACNHGTTEGGATCKKHSRNENQRHPLDLAAYPGKRRDTEGGATRIKSAPMKNQRHPQPIKRRFIIGPVCR